VRNCILLLGLNILVVAHKCGGILGEQILIPDKKKYEAFGDGVQSMLYR
jgi:hypothetical protein